MNVDMVYPFDDTHSMASEWTESFALRLRIPEWADDAPLLVGGVPVALAGASGVRVEEDGHVPLGHDWSKADDVVLALPRRARVTRRERQAASVRLWPLAMMY